MSRLNHDQIRAVFAKIAKALDRTLLEKSDGSFELIPEYFWTAPDGTKYRGILVADEVGVQLRLDLVVTP